MTEELNEINESELIEQAARKQMAIEAGIQQETNVVQVEEEPAQEEPTITNETINAPIQKTTEELIQELRDENSKLRKGINKTNGTYGNEIKKLKVVLHILLMIFFMLRQHQARSAILLSISRKSTVISNYFLTSFLKPNSINSTKSLFYQKF